MQAAMSHSGRPEIKNLIKIEAKLHYTILINKPASKITYENQNKVFYEVYRDNYIH